MARHRLPKRPVLLAAGALAMGVVGIASAQQERAGGQVLDLTVGQSLQYSDNIDLRAGDTDHILRSSTSLGLAFADVTRTQALRFSTSASYDMDSDGSSEVSDPFARFSYTRLGANSRFEFRGSFERRNLDDEVFTFVEADPETELPVSQEAKIEGGVRSNSSYGLVLETGIEGPVGFTLDLSGAARRYADTADPDLYATDDHRVRMAARFLVSPVLTARLTASARRYDAEDADETERRETSVGAGMTLDISPTLRFDAALRQQRSEVDRISGDTVTEGLAVDTGLTWALANGGFTLGLSSEVTPNGRRSALRADRNMTLRREGTLSYGVALSKTEGFELEPLFRLAYAQPLKRGSFGIELSQEARTDEEDDSAVILTRLNLSYAMPLSKTVDWTNTLGLARVNAQSDSGEDRETLNLSSSVSGQIDSLSSWSAGVTYSETQISDATSSESDQRLGLRLSYRRELARDWDLLTSYNHTAIRESDAADRSSNTLSVGLERAFSFRP